jgi:hypothetical protein
MALNLYNSIFNIQSFMPIHSQFLIVKIALTSKTDSTWFICHPQALEIFPEKTFISKMCDHPNHMSYFGILNFLLILRD